MDPVFIKAHKLLFSNEPDSAEQLRGLLDQALKQRYGNTVSLSTALPTTVSSFFILLLALSSLYSLTSGMKPTTTEADIGPKPITQNPNDPGSDGSEESNASPENDKEDDLALDLLQEELKCVVCK